VIHPSHDEPGWPELRAETVRLLRRAWRRPIVVTVAALACVASGLGLAAMRPLRARTAVVLRMTATDPTRPLGATWNSRALRGHVTEVVFSQQALRGVIRRHELYGFGMDGFDATAAIATLRERTTVEVAPNRMSALLPAAERPLSAYVRIAFDDANPERGRAVARELGRLVAATGHTQLREDARTAVFAHEVTAAGVRGLLGRLRVDEARARAVRGASLQDAVRAMEERMEREDQALGQARARLEAARSEDPRALDIDLLVPPTPAPAPRFGKRMGLVAIAATLLSLPLAALAVGAFDRGIYGTADVSRLGFPCLGRLPRRHGPGAGEEAA